MGQLHLALLGTPEVRHGGQIVTFRTRKALALLTYLVDEVGSRRGAVCCSDSPGKDTPSW